ncbi:hypothetical protein F511_36136 [Dorcoceras hygrometricum]|uniref:Uncharacterized protein n=1 Tax=Dorcoceras hygrometricum TaxID=472368 RepID=A0A2Z7BR10_9LAMI|nr:hypothetical protein F511_36136 [Dorcoceras hygrometricum]
MLCMRTRLQPKRWEPKNLKELLNNRYESTEQQYNSGHGMLANRSQQGHEVYESYPLVLNKHPGTHRSNTTRHKRHGYNRVPRNTDLTPAKPNTNTSSGTVTQKPRIGSYELNQICPTLITQQKALNKAQASRKPPEAITNKASQQEESSATTLTSIGDIYHRQSEKISGIERWTLRKECWKRRIRFSRHLDALFNFFPKRCHHFSLHRLRSSLIVRCLSLEGSSLRDDRIRVRLVLLDLVVVAPEVCRVDSAEVAI